MFNYVGYIMIGMIAMSITTASGQRLAGIFIGQSAGSIQTFVVQEAQGHYNAGGVAC